MPHTVYALADMSDIPAKLVDFVTNNMTGWSAATGSAGPNGETTCTVTIPAGTNSPARTLKIMSLEDPTLDYSNRHPGSYTSVAFDGGSPVANDCRAYAPLVATGSGSHDAQGRVASQLHVFGWPASGGGSDAEAIAMVIEFSDLHFRHVYFGRIERHGSYGDGTVFTASNIDAKRDFGSGSGRPWDDQRSRHVFSAIALSSGTMADWSDTHAGGLLIDHADDPHRFRQLYMPRYGSYSHSGDPDRHGDGDEIFGGPMDGPIDGLLQSGFAPMTNANLMATIELFANVDTGSSGRFYRAMGHPIGVRAINLTDLVPGQSVPLGTDIWHVFPSARQNLTDKYHDYSVHDGYWPDFENTGPIGFAYKE